MKHSVTFYHLFFAILLLGSIATMIILVPPDHAGLIALMVGLISFTSFYITALFTENRNTRVLVAIFFAVFFGINSVLGLNLLNTTLLLSFIIGLKLLLK